jgi:hypothetical protein
MCAKAYTMISLDGLATRHIYPFETVCIISLNISHSSPSPRPPLRPLLQLLEATIITLISAMSSCCDPPKPSLSSPNKSNPPSQDSHNDQESLASHLLSLSPVLSALLHSSCCWLPVGYFNASRFIHHPILTRLVTTNFVVQAVLDLTSIGSASASSISHLRPFFSAITFLVLMDSIGRHGFTNRNLLRSLVSVLILLFPTALAYFQPTAPVEAPRHSCH